MNKGQSLIEVLVAVFIGVILFIAAVAVITPVLRSNTAATKAQVASALARELMENVVVMSERDWHIIDGLATAPTTYYLSTTTFPTASFATSTGKESVVVATTTYARYFFLENVTRDNAGILGGSNNDPSTKKVTVVYSWPQSATKTITRYITRSRNNIYIQTDWSGGPDPIFPWVPATITNSKFATSVNIDYVSSTGSIIIQGY